MLAAVQADATSSRVYDVDTTESRMRRTLTLKPCMKHSTSVFLMAGEFVSTSASRYASSTADRTISE